MVKHHYSDEKRLDFSGFLSYFQSFCVEIAKRKMEEVNKCFGSVESGTKSKDIEYGVN